jgi:hypothetical protein
LNEIKNLKNEIATELIIGTAVGIVVAIGVLFVLNILNGLAYATIIIWIAFAIFSILCFRPLSWAAPRKTLAFLSGLFIAISLINYIYNTLLVTYNIDFPYSSLRTIGVISLVGIGISIGFMIEIILGLKKKIEEQVTP